MLHSDHSWRLESNTASNSESNAEQDAVNASILHLTSGESTALVDHVQTWRYSVDARQYGFFLAKKSRNHVPVEQNEGSESANRESNPHNRSPTPEPPGDNLEFEWVIGSLSKYHDGFFDGILPEDQYICFTDPSTYPMYPGWMLRNLLVLIRRRWQLRKVQILCYRDIQARRDDARSIILRVEASDINVPASEVEKPMSLEMPKVTGWERNAAGKLTSKIANLGEYMDPQR